MLRPGLAILTLFFSPFIIQAQTPSPSDSLRQLLEVTTEGEQRLNLLNQLYEEVKYDSLDWARQIANEAYYIGEAFPNHLSYALASYHLGSSHYNDRKIDSSNFYYEIALNIYLKKQDTTGIILCMKGIGLNHFTKNQYVKALEIYLKGLKLAEQVDHKLAIREITSQIGFIYISQENFDVGLNYLIQSYELAKSNVDIDLVKNIFNIANVMERAKRYDEALSYLDTMVMYTKQLDFTFGLGKAYGLKSYILNEIEQYDEALSAINQALDIFESLGADIEVFELIMAKARVYQEDGKFQLMLIEINKAEPFINGIEDFHLLFEYKDASYTCYKNLGLHQKALEIHEEVYALRDSIFHLGNAEKINELTTKYETEKKDQEIKNLFQQTQIQELQIQQGNMMLIFGVVLILVVVLIAFLIYQRKQHAYQQSVSEMQQKLLRLQMNPHFFFNALGSIQDFILKNDAKSASMYLAKFSKLMRQTLEFSREEVVTLSDEKELLTNYIEIQRLSTGQPFEYDILIDESLDEEETTIPPMFAQPFIENAVEHGKLGDIKDGKLEIHFKKQGTQLLLEIKDNGLGIQSYSRSGHKSLATIITRERLQLLEKKYSTHFELNINPANTDAERKGTHVSVTLPLNR